MGPPPAAMAARSLSFGIRSLSPEVGTLLGTFYLLRDVPKWVLGEVPTSWASP